MRLQTLEYKEYEAAEQEWILDGLRLGPRNLIVGKNASGKTRTLNVINGLSTFLTGNGKPGLSGKYDALFEDAKRSIRYEVHCLDSAVSFERFSVDGKVLMERGPSGEGTIWAEQEKSELRFQTPPSQFAAVARRDKLQHSFFEPLHAWGESVRHYLFGSSLGKKHLAIFHDTAPKHDERDTNAIVAIFRAADKEFGEQFRNSIIRDMGSIGYDIERIGVEPLVSVRISPVASGEVVGIYVKERGLRGITDQITISQGMFRALALFIHLNSCQLRGTGTCVLIDDIGEGLDFDRSCSLIETLREKTHDDRIQLVMTTNDRFIMNRVPLEEWSVLQRVGGTVRVRNFENSREIFEEFKFTGLSNFNFLEMDVLGGNHATSQRA